MTPDTAAITIKYERRTINEKLESLKRKSENAESAFAREIADGLLASPKELNPKFFYDGAGSALFEKICRLDEYHIPRAESEILHSFGSEIAAYAHNVGRLVELGSGASVKTHALLDSLDAKNRAIQYVPIDISDVIEKNCIPLLDAYGKLSVIGIVDTYEGGLDLVDTLDSVPSLTAFLGSSLGNMGHDDALAFLRRVRKCMAAGDMFLIGLDISNDEERLRAAYDDASGITAQFNKNILYHINAKLGADFDPDKFEHHIEYDVQKMCISMHLRSLQRQTVHMPKPGIDVLFEGGELLHTENSFKYTPNLIRSMLPDVGMRVEKIWTDKNNLFALTLASAA